VSPAAFAEKLRVLAVDGVLVAEGVRGVLGVLGREDAIEGVRGAGDGAANFTGAFVASGDETEDGYDGNVGFGRSEERRLDPRRRFLAGACDFTGDCVKGEVVPLFEDGALKALMEGVFEVRASPCDWGRGVATGVDDDDNDDWGRGVVTGVDGGARRIPVPGVTACAGKLRTAGLCGGRVSARRACGIS
jgi:hypothetical protein